MTQRRTPSGQGPTRRPGQGARAGRGAARRASAGRVAARDTPGGGEPRRTPTARSAEPSRSANRPAAARRAGVGGATKRTTAPQPRRMTGRATVLLVILTALALGYTYPVRVYLDQKADIARIQAAQDDQRARIEGLREEVLKWQDDEYVRIQAKRRFYYVRPGETPLIPWWTGEEAAAGAGTTTGQAEAPVRPWYDTLWSSIQAADQEPVR